MAEQREAEQQETEQDESTNTGQSEAHEAAEASKEEYEQAQKTMEEWEGKDELPTDLEDWPSDKAKYVTFGGGEGDHGYDEGPEQKLGPSEVRHHDDGSGEVSGEMADDPDEYKSDPIPGGPTDPDAPKGPGTGLGEDD